MKTILIAGAAGFLGSQLAKALLPSGHRLIGIDNLSTGSMNNLKPLSAEPAFRFIELDVTSPELLELDALSGVNEIYHLASPASPRFYQAMPFETIAANTAGTRNLLELALRNDAALVYASTSEVYGDPEVHPQREDYLGHVNTWGPRACYDEGKRLGEVICYEYWSRYKAKVKVARLFNTYSAGLRNDDGRVISNFVTQALSGNEMTVYGNGLQTRSFCYADDTIRALIRLMEKDEATGEIVNIGNPQEYTILEVARMVAALTQSESTIAFHPLPKDDPRQRRPDIAKAKRLLDWEPEIDLTEGLTRTIRAYREQAASGEAK